jgi:hypothetical protein
LEDWPLPAIDPLRELREYQSIEAIVTLTVTTTYDTVTTFFCSKPHALEYLEQNLLDEAKELAKE